MAGVAFWGLSLVYVVATGKLLTGLLRSAKAAARITEDEEPQDTCIQREGQGPNENRKHLSPLPTAS